MVFLRKYIVFQRTPKRSRGGPWVGFSRKSGAPGGAGPPPGGARHFLGGPSGPIRGNPLTLGGPEGGPREPFFFQGAHLLNWGAPKTIKNPLCFILFSPLWDFWEIVQKGPKGATQQGRIQGVQGGSQMGPKGPSGVPGGGQGGPRGPKGPSRGGKGGAQGATPDIEPTSGERIEGPMGPLGDIGGTKNSKNFEVS